METTKLRGYYEWYTDQNWEEPGLTIVFLDSLYLVVVFVWCGGARARKTSQRRTERQ